MTPKTMDGNMNVKNAADFHICLKASIIAI